MVPKLPRQLTLPSGAVVHLQRREPHGPPLAPGPDAPLFDEALTALAEGRVVVTQGGARVDARAMVLRDFHVLRAVLARSGVIAEEELELPCHNCEATIRARPCALLEIAPWVDGELDDALLDVTLPLGEPVEVDPLPIGRARIARTVTFEERTVAHAMPLFAAIAKKDLIIDETFVRALGVVALDAERDPKRIASALATCDDAAFASVADAFLATHYVPRLACVTFCAACGARTDLDAPEVRELVPGDGASGGGSPSAFPDFEAFADRAREIARPLMESPPTDQVELVIEDGTPAVDDGGDTLLGGYLPPPHPDDATTALRAPLITVYYRTFRALWEEEGPYDWEDELTETIEHELEHHVYFLRGADPMHDEEIEAIRQEAVRVVGRREAGRRELVGFGTSLRDFAVRTWPLWIIATIALALSFAQC